MNPKRLEATIQAAKNGSDDAFHSLLDAYANRLYGYFLRAVRNPHDAEDLLGEVALRLVRQLKSYDETGRFEPWLFRIAANLVRDRFRRRKVRGHRFSLHAKEDDEIPLADKLQASNESVDHRLQASENSERINDALQSLDETTQQMILMRHYGEMRFKEIARLFECPIGTALAKVHRGLKQMRTHLEKTQQE